jgi:hypothetical protein
MSESGFKNVRMRFASDESGWGQLIEEGRVLINNIPYTDRLNIGDLVEVEEVDGLLTVKRVLKRQLEGKTAVEYPAPHRENYSKLFTAWRNAGMRCEGIIEGLALVAHHKNQDPMAIAAAAGVTATLHSSQPELEPVPS